MLITVLPSVVLGTLVLGIAILYLRNLYNNARGPSFPPGPDGLPLVGHLFNSPRGAPWLSFSRMAAKYGDLVHLKVLNRHTILVSSAEVASDLFDKRSALYSNRFYSVMLNELMGMEWSFGRMNYGEPWRQRRKTFHHYYSAAAVEKYEGIILDNVQRFLVRLRNHPENFFGHARFVFAAMLLNVTYGITIEDESNEHLIAAEAWQHGFNQAILPGRFWVDYFPILKYIPEWFPGAAFKRSAAKWRENMYKARDHTFNVAKASMADDTAIPCVVTDALDSIEDNEDRTEKELLIRHSIATAFGAGVDTSAPTLQIFFYAMLTHPGVQKKAQEELERVVGLNRLPIMDDRAKLPYIEAILKELLRWNPVTPLALPHFTAAEDEYHGYRIPKGSIVLGNAWSVLDSCTSFIIVDLT
ncbi:hypothetical protein QCA50_007556 [Cerrena zonata]|uniref:Cytochrome P450 n=1 Tax=Cerrena zonata TaxID=2478898 RepID=A0AAW0G8V8_9APHY